MAKISARGDSKHKAWKHEDGRELLLTMQGRFLYKWQRGATWTLVCAGRVTLDYARGYATERGYEAA